MPLFITSFIEMLIVAIVFANLFTVKLRKLEIVFVAIIMSTPAILIFRLIPLMYIAMLVSNIISIIVLTFFSYMKKESLKMSGFFATFTITICMFAVFITSSVGYQFLIHFIEEVGRDVVLGGFVTFFVFILMFFAIAFSFSLKMGNFLKKRLLTLDEPLRNTFSKYLLYGSIITCAVFLIINFLRGFIAEMIGYPLVYTIAMSGSFIMLVFAIFSFETSMRKEVDLRKKDESLANLREQAKNLTGLSKEARRFKHDHENLMLGFHKHLKNSDIESALEYYDKYMVAFYKSMADINKGLDMLDKIKSLELQGILSYKIPSAQRAGINVIIDVSDDMKPIPNEHLMDVCRITGILIDNAIDACVGVDKPVLRLGVLNKAPATLIVIENNFFTAPDLGLIAEEGYTTKDDGQGLGLYTVAGIIENNPNLGLATKIKDEYFVQLLSILP